jgi:hypothetical protein
MSQIVNPSSAAAGPPGSANSVSATLDFGTPAQGESDTATVTVSAVWVTGSTKLVPSLAGSSADHDAEDGLLEEIILTCTNIVGGVGFDVVGHAPNGTWGRYSINIIGV